MTETIAAAILAVNTLLAGSFAAYPPPAPADTGCGAGMTHFEASGCQPEVVPPGMVRAEDGSVVPVSFYMGDTNTKGGK